MIRPCVSLLGVLIGLALVGSQPASSAGREVLQESQAMPFTVEGKIHRLEGKKITLSTEENMLFHVLYDDKTEIRRKDGSAGSAKDLRVGTTIHVEGDLSESGEIAAHRIAIQGEPAKQP